MDIAGLPVIVTGAASGLGAATAGYLLDRGARVALLDRSLEGIVVAEGEASRALRMDVTDPDSVADAVAAAVAWFGAPRALVHCAGIVHSEKTLGRGGMHDPDTFGAVLDVNLAGSFAVVRAVAAAMAEGAPDADGGRGAIVLTASVAAFEGQKGQVAYAASKAGVAGMVLPLARDLARSGIRVNAIAPGVFLTPMLESLGSEICDGLARDVVFPPRLGAPGEFAHACGFLIENGYVNGTTLRLDGGIRLP